MNEKKSRLERLQQKLYSKTFDPSHEDATLSDKKYSVDSDWDPNNNDGQQSEKSIFPDDTSEEKTNNKTLIGILIGAIVFFVASLAYAYFIFVGGGQAKIENDVSIDIVGPVSVGGGEKLALDVVLQNNNGIDMETVDIIVDYPEGTKSADDLITDLKRTREDLGTIENGEVVRKTITAALFGEENTNKEILVTIEYRIPDSNAIFQKQKSFQVALNAAPVRITIEGLKEISAGQELELDVVISSNSAKKLENVMLQASYPFGFRFDSASIDPTESNNTWIFEELEAGAEIPLTIKGFIEGQNEEERFFRFNTGIVSENDSDSLGIIFNNTFHNVVVKKSFVGLEMVIQGSSAKEVAVNSGEQVSTILTLVNNTNDTIREAEIRLKLSGEALDKREVTPEGGFYNSLGNEIIWNSETSEQFDEIGPRENVRLQFQFRTVSLADGSKSLKNPEIRLNAEVSGVRISESDVEENLVGNTDAVVRVLSDVPLAARTHYGEGPFINTGTIPPKADNETTYTLEFSVANNSNNLSGAVMEIALPSYVSWNNKISPANSGVSFDSGSRKIIWNLGNVESGVGYTSAARKVYVQVTLIPSLSQVGNSVELTRSINFKAVDTFANGEIQKTVKNPTTQIYGQDISNNTQNVVE